MGFHTKNIRNAVLLGHPGAGKTTLAECMLFEANAIPRRGSPEERNTVSDYTLIEKERGNSIFSSLMHVNWKDSKINLIDTPGYDDFVGEIVSSLKVADTGVMLLNACNGVEVGTELIWQYIDKYETPALFVINQLDHTKADFESTVEQARERFGNKVQLIQYPLNEGIGFNTIVDGLRMVMYVFSDDGGKPRKERIPPEEMDRAMEIHNALVEAAAENDERLMEKFFKAGSLSEEELTEGLRIAIANQEIYPVFCCAAARNMGSGRIMGFINDICPNPAERPNAKLHDGTSLPCTMNNPTTVFIYKTISEAQVGNVSYFKVYSGKLSAGDELTNAYNRQTERFTQLFFANGKGRISTSDICAGDLGVTLKLKDSHTNQTLNTKDTNRKIEQMHFPESRIRVAIAPPGKAEMEKLMKALHTIEEEDPTLQIEQSPTLKQTLLHGQGQLHLELIKHRIEQVYGIKMAYIRPRISYRETITSLADVSYRHKKQSGGSGQFAELHMRVEPFYDEMPAPNGLNVRKKEIEVLPWGGKLAFYWCIVGGSIDAKYANAIKKGILQRMESGPLTGSPCQDIRVSIYDGKMHSVDSNDTSFMLAARMAMRDAIHQASPQILEPIYNLNILCTSDTMGDIMGDLQTRRAMILGMDTEGHYQKIMARVPQKEMYRYSSSLRSLSQGRAKFNRSLIGYEPMPYDIQEELITSYNDTEVEV